MNFTRLENHRLIESQLESIVIFDERVELRFLLENEEAVLRTAIVKDRHDNSWLNWLN